MTRNAGVNDSSIPMMTSVALMYVSFIHHSIVTDSFGRSMVSMIGVLSLVVVIVGVCPFYSVSGVSTCSKKR